MEVEFVPIDYDSIDVNGRNIIRIIGRSAKGKRICVIDRYEPSFFIILKDEYAKDAKEIIKKIKSIVVEKKSRSSKIEKATVVKKKFLGKPVTAIQVFITNHKDAQEIASEIGDLEEIMCRREYDIPLITKYIKERGIDPLMWYTVSGSVTSQEDFGGFADNLDVEMCITAESFKKVDSKKPYKPRVLAYDIETSGFDSSKSEVLMVALYGENFEKVITHKKAKSPQKYVEFVDNSKDLIDRTVEAIKEYDPDVLTGYFSDGFDLPFLKDEAKKHKTKLSLGLDDSEPIFSRGKLHYGRINGIVHVDLFRFISYVFSQYLKAESLSLDNVAEELIGKNKEEFDFSLLSQDMSDEDWKKFYSYNLQDTRVTFELFEKVWPDLFEFVSIIKEPLFEVSRNSMATHVENYLIHNIDKFDEIVERKPKGDDIASRRSKPRFEGAFVLEPTPGLYEDVAMFDFTSMYSSVIISYNLSKSTLQDDGSFSEEKGFFPSMLEEILKLRKKYKKEFAKDKSGMQEARSNAYKLLANASYGYQAFFGARYYSYEAASATARFARDNIKTAIENIENVGYKVIYSDTDSIAFLRGKKSKSDVKKFLDALNRDMPGIMELDLEDFYKRAIFVHGRSSEKGAKKKYAMLAEDGSLKIKGFETVRRDWCRLARNLQSRIIGEILEDGDVSRALISLKECIKELESHKIDRSKLIIKTKLKKPIKSYQSKGPHVVAAEKMQKQGKKVGEGSLIEYFIGKLDSKRKKIGDAVFLPDEDREYDERYYLENQVLPAVENIFDVFGVEVEQEISDKKQTNLMDF